MSIGVKMRIDGLPDIGVYALLAGRSGGQILYGGTGAGDDLTLYSTSDSTKGNIFIGRLTLTDATNGDGIVFGSLGTATKAIDLSAGGLSGSGDYWIYNSTTNYWDATGAVAVSLSLSVPTFYTDRILGTSSALNIRMGLTSTLSLIAGTVNAVGSLTSCSSNGTTTITKNGHGLTLAIGELVHITGATTASDKGFYRIASFTVNTIVVDRALSGTDADVALTVYKDVISVHATDATNGQIITSWSAQNKPLQIGGTVLAATTNLDSADIYIGGDIGFSQTQAASNQAGTLATVHTAGNPGIYLKFNVGGTWYAFPGWAIP